MVKQVIAEDSVFDYLRNLKCDNNYNCGIIVGSQTRDLNKMVARLIKCPYQESKPWTSINQIDSSWISGHAMQVLNLLPGGLDIIGFFVIGPEKEQNRVQNTLKKVCHNSFKTLKSGDNYQIVNSIKDNWVCVHFSSSTCNVISSKVYNVSDFKDMGNHIDWKYQNKEIPWDCCTSTVNVNIDIYCNNEENNSNISKFVTECVKNFSDLYDKSFMIFDGKVRKSEEMFISSTNELNKTKGVKGKKQVQNIHIQKQYSCSLISPSGWVEILNNKEHEHTSHHIKFEGKLDIMCYFLPKCTVSDILECFQSDISRSINQRCELVLEQVEENKVPSTVFWPKRVYMKCDDNVNIQYSEYIIDGELVSDCITRFEETFDTKSTVIESSEQFLSIRKMEKNCIEPTFDQEIMPKNTTSSNYNIRAIIAAGMAAVVGVIAWFIEF